MIEQDTFGSGALDLTRWEVNAPLNRSRVVQAGGYLHCISDGSYASPCFASSVFGPGAGVGRRQKLVGDFDVQVQFSGWSPGATGASSAFLNLWQDSNNQFHVKRRSTPDCVQGVTLIGGVLTNGPVVGSSGATSGTLRVTRAGSTWTGYFNGASIFSISAFTGDVVLIIATLIDEGFTPGQTAVANWSNYQLASGALAPAVMTCPQDTLARSLGPEFYGQDIWLDVTKGSGPDRRVTPDGDWLLVQGREALRQSLLRRYLTNPGEWATKENYGAGVRMFVKAKNVKAAREELTSRIKQQSLMDFRVERVDDVRISWTATGRINVDVHIIPRGQLDRNKPVTISFGVD